MDSTSIPDRAEARAAARHGRTRGLRSLTAAVLALALAGCAAPHAFAPIGTPAKTASGQLRYAYGERTVIGELSLFRSATGSRLEFTKAGSVVLMRVTADATHFRFEGPLARGTAEYARGAKLPEHLTAWAELATAEPPPSRKTLTHGQETITVVLPPLR